MEHRNCIFRFADIEVDERNFSVTKAGEVLPLEPKVFKILQFLLHHPGRVVTKDELLAAVWSDTSVSESSLTRSVATLRRLLGDDIREPRYIATVPTVGYRFLCNIEVAQNGLIHESAFGVILESQVGQKEPTAAQSPAEPASDINPTHLQKRKPGKGGLYWAVGGVAAVVAVVTGWWLEPRPATPVVEGVSRITDDGNPKVAFGLVADGARVYFIEMRDGTQVLVEVAVTGGESGLVINSVANPYVLDIASNPSRLLLRGYAGPLWILPLPAGPPRKLITPEADDAAFFKNGSIVFVNRGVLYLAKEDGSDPRKLCSFPAYADAPTISPDGKRIRLNVYRNELIREVWEVNSDGSNPHPVLKDWQNRLDAETGFWTADGRFFVFESRKPERTDLWVLPESKGWFGRMPTPIRLTNGPLSYERPFSSSDGKHIYAIGRRQRGELVRFDRRSRHFEPFLSGISAIDATLSNDGKWVAYASYPDHSLWRCRTDGTDRLRLTYSPIWVEYPRISPDGKWVAYGAPDLNGKKAAYLISMEGGSPRKIVDNALFGVNWSPDGNSVVAQVSLENTNTANSTSYVGLDNAIVQITNLRTGTNQAIPDSATKGGPWWPTPNKLVACDCTSLGCDFKTYDFQAQKWSFLSDLDFENWATSQDGKYLYFVGGIPSMVSRIRLSDHKTEEITSLKDFRRIALDTFTEAYPTTSWVGVTPDGDPLLTRDIGSDEIYDIALRWH